MPSGERRTDPYGDVEYRHGTFEDHPAAKTQAYAAEDVQSDEIPPKAMYRHEQLMKLLSTLDTSVSKLGSRLEVVLLPERPQPTEGDPNRAPKEMDQYSIIEARHKMYLQALIGIVGKIEDLVERVDL